jgi:hypothetical protein
MSSDLEIPSRNRLHTGTGHWMLQCRVTVGVKSLVNWGDQIVVCTTQNVTSRLQSMELLWYIYARRVILGCLLPLHSQKKNQLSYDELMNHEGMNDGILNLKHTPKTPSNKNNKTISIFYFIEIDAGRITRKPNHSCNSEPLQFSPSSSICAAARIECRETARRRGATSCEWALPPRVCAAPGPSRSSGRPDPPAAGRAAERKTGRMRAVARRRRLFAISIGPLHHSDSDIISFGPLSNDRFWPITE